MFRSAGSCSRRCCPATSPSRPASSNWSRTRSPGWRPTGASRSCSSHSASAPSWRLGRVRHPVAICAAMLIGLASAVARRRTVLADRQHRPGRVRSHRHPGPHPGRGDQAAGRHSSAMVGRQLPHLRPDRCPSGLVWALAEAQGHLQGQQPRSPSASPSGRAVPGIQLHRAGHTDILASLVSIGSMLLLLRFWRPRSIWRFEA